MIQNQTKNSFVKTSITFQHKNFFVWFQKRFLSLCRHQNKSDTSAQRPPIKRENKEFPFFSFSLFFFFFFFFFFPFLLFFSSFCLTHFSETKKHKTPQHANKKLQKLWKIFSIIFSTYWLIALHSSDRSNLFFPQFADAKSTQFSQMGFLLFFLFAKFGFFLVSKTIMSGVHWKCMNPRNESANPSDTWRPMRPFTIAQCRGPSD